MSMSTRLGKVNASLLAILMALAAADPPPASAQQAAAAPKPTDTQTIYEATVESSSQPDHPGSAGTDHTAAEYPDAPAPQPTQSNSSTANQSTAPATNSDQHEQEQRPLGTAAAPETKPTGVAGSRPAGAVIAPAKQRRVHAILISIGLLAGAGIAIGTVAALSNGSPARP